MPGGWSTLKHRDFAFVCGARFAVTLALNMTGVAILWYVYDVTASTFALGYLGLAGFLPAIALALVTGIVADRIDRRYIMFVCDLTLMATGLALWWLVTANHGIVWPIYLIVILVSASRAFHNPASQAIIPALVPATQLSSAIALASGMFQAAQILGPALGGLLYAVDASLPFIAAAALYAVSALAALAVRYRSSPASRSVQITLSSLVAGFAFAWNKPVVLGAVSLDMFVVMFGGVVVLLPVFAKDVLQVGPEGLGLLRAAPAVGAIGMAIWLSQNQYVHRHTGSRLFATIAVFGLATVGFGLSHSFVLSLACLVVIGASDMVSVVIRHTLVQTETPDDLRGRVSAVNSLFITASSELGQARAGIVAGFAGVVAAVVIGGLAAASLAVLWPRLFPQLARRKYLIEPEGGRPDGVGPAPERGTASG